VIEHVATDPGQKDARERTVSPGQLASLISRDERSAFAGQMRARRRRGRPRIVDGQRSVPLTVNVPESLYDRLVQLAAQRRSDLAPLVRSLLEYSTKK
jgi:hypothetical protein